MQKKAWILSYYPCLILKLGKNLILLASDRFSNRNKVQIHKDGGATAKD